MNDYEDSFDEESTGTSSPRSSGSSTPKSARSPVTTQAPPAVPQTLSVPVPVPVPVSDTAAASPSPLPAPTPSATASTTDAAPQSTKASDESSHDGSRRRSTGTDLLERALAAGIWRKARDEDTGRPYFYNVLTKEKTWDLRKWLLGDSSHHDSESSTRRSSGMPGHGESMSTYSEATIGDGDPARFRRARNADLNSEFNQFGTFVAFNSHAPSLARSSVPFESAVQPTSELGMSVSRGPSAVSDALISPKPSLTTPHGDTDAGRSSPLEQGAVHTDSPPAQPARAPDAPSETAAHRGGSAHEEEENSSADPSSVFSTLSQHLKAPLVTTTSSANAIAPTQKPLMSAASEHDARYGPLTNGGSVVPQLSLSNAILGQRSGDASAMTSSRAAFVSPVSPPTLHMTLPDLPQPGFDKSRFPLGSGAAPALTTAPSYPGVALAAEPSAQPPGEWAGLTFTTQVPPPLPPPSSGYAPAPAAVAPPEDPKIVELRETSEAVERLVKAFAMLRGHAPSEKHEATARRAPSPETKIASQDFAVTRPGLASTVRQNMTAAPTTGTSEDTACTSTSASATAARVRQKLADPSSQQRVPEDAEGQQLVEEVLLSCVVEMLQSTATREASTAQLVQRLKHRPTHETVSAESFRTADRAQSFGADSRQGGAYPASSSASTMRGRRDGALHPDRGNVFNLFDGEMGAFSGQSEDADAALYHSVQHALRTYVLSHVVSTRGRLASSFVPSPPSADEKQATTMSPHVAWTVLVDLLTVCSDIAETCFNAMDAAALLSYPVLVRYCGDVALEHLTRNAMHCLPFETVSSSAASRSAVETPADEMAARPLFRLEFWVTRQKLFVVMEAVRECLRLDIVQEASSFPSSTFESGSAAVRLIHPKALIPPTTPLLALVALSRNVSQAYGKGQEALSTRQRAGAGAGGRHRTRSGPGAASVDDNSGGEDDENADFFGVARKGIESMTYTVSVLATNLLEEESTRTSFSGDGATTAYEDLTQAVSETVSELLTDPAIAAALQRRAKDKYAHIVSLRDSLHKDAKSDREKRIIAKAEAEAERVVRHIMQEMVARDPTTALSRK